MQSKPMSQAVARSEDRLLRADAAEGLMARRELGRPRPDDAELAASLMGGILETQADDGSWDGALVQTADTLLRLRALAAVDAGASGPGAAERGIARGIAWLRGRQGEPGRYGDGCSAERHRLGLCHHFLGGFFSPAPGTAPIAPLRLPTDGEIEAEPDARLAASCIALHALFLLGRDSTDLRLHVEGLRRIVGLWDRWTTELFVPTVGLLALRALLAAPQTSATHGALDRGLAMVRDSQRADGSWPEADIFIALDLLLGAANAGYAGHDWNAALKRGASLLGAMQSEDGAWGRESPPLRTLIGWRVLREAADRLGPDASRQPAS